MMIALYVCLGLLLFFSGYYLGNQMGRTEFIRGYLAKNRLSEHD